MAYPKPTYTGEIDVEDMVYRNNGNSQKNYLSMLNNSIKILYHFMNKTMYTSVNVKENPNTSNELMYRSATTSDDITVNYVFKTRKGLPLLNITMHSFKTPVEPLKKELTDLVLAACEKTKKTVKKNQRS